MERMLVQSSGAMGIEVMKLKIEHERTGMGVFVKLQFETMMIFW